MALKEKINEAIETLNAIANTTLDTVYVVDGSDTDITLEVNVGAERQTSDMTIKIDNEIVIEKQAGDFAKKVIGSNKSLEERTLSLVATIADTSRTTNLTSLNLHLRGGFIPADFPLSKTVENEGQSADYLCLIHFLNRKK